MMESADRALDHEHNPIQDWGFIKTYIISDSFLKFLSGISSIPLVGRLFKSYLFDHFSVAYDIIVNFIEGHEEATHMIVKVIENQNFVSKILKESQTQMHEAEQYMNQHIEEMFPEICKAVQHRRA